MHPEEAVCHLSANSAAGEALGLVDEAAEGAFQGQGFGGQGAPPEKSKLCPR